MRKHEYVTSSEVPVQTSVAEIREALAKIGVTPLEIDCRWDVQSGAAFARFKWNGGTYERRSTMQPNASKNMRVICLNLKQKVLAHLREVEPFGDSMYKYLQIEGSREAAQARATNYQPSPGALGAYAVLGVDPLAPDEAVEAQYRRQLKAWHPDKHATDPDMAAHATSKTAEINAAWQTIKQDRRIP